MPARGASIRPVVVGSATVTSRPGSEDGADLLDEVKSTTGRDGQFSWPAAKFRLAVRARRRYVLQRVYEAQVRAQLES
jgi:hypothetical protein